VLTLSGAVGTRAVETQVMPESRAIWLMAIAGATGVAGHVFLYIAYRIGPARSVAPFMYTLMIWAVLSGLLLFGDVPNALAIAGMVLVAIGSTSYMLLGLHLGETDPSSVSRTLQGFLSGIGFLGGAVIFKSGYDVKGIKAAAAVWITGASGLAIATSYWLLGLTLGLVTAIIMFVSDSFPDEDRRRRQEP